MSRQSNPFSRGFSVEAFIDRGQTKENRQSRELEVCDRARAAIQSTLAACDVGLRADLSLALIAEATRAATSEHPPERVQSHLGKVAHEHGATINHRKPIRAAADALFKGDAA